MKANVLASSLVLSGALGSVLPNADGASSGRSLRSSHLGKRECAHNNLLRCFIATPSLAFPFCSSSAGIASPTAKTVLVTITPTVSVTALTTTTETLSSTETSTTKSTATTTTVQTLTQVGAQPGPTTITVTGVTTYKKRTTITVTIPPTEAGPQDHCSSTFTFTKRAVPATSLACIADLKPTPKSVTSVCSCFVGSVAATISPVIETLYAPTVYVTPATSTQTTSTTTVDTVTITEVSTTTQTDTYTTTVCIITEI